MTLDFFSCLDELSRWNAAEMVGLDTMGSLYDRDGDHPDGFMAVFLSHSSITEMRGGE